MRGPALTHIRLSACICMGRSVAAGARSLASGQGKVPRAMRAAARADASKGAVDRPMDARSATTDVAVCSLCVFEPAAGAARRMPAKWTPRPANLRARRSQINRPRYSTQDREEEQQLERASTCRRERRVQSASTNKRTLPRQGQGHAARGTRTMSEADHTAAADEFPRPATYCTSMLHGDAGAPNIVAQTNSMSRPSLRWNSCCG